MTRQLFPSPSQGALICAGGGKEGRLAAAPASVGAGRQDPAPHSRVWTRVPAVFSTASRPFWGSCSWRQSGACGERQAPASRSSEPRLWGLGVPCCSLTTAELPPPGASVRSGSNSQQAAIRGAGRRQNFPCLCVGSWAGVSVVEFRLFVVVLTQDLEAPSLISAFLQRL